MGEPSLAVVPHQRQTDEGLRRYHTEVEEEQLQREHELRCRSKELYKKGVVTLRYLRAHQCKIRRFLDRVAKKLEVD